MNAYKVTGNLHHNTAVYEPGEILELTDEEAKPLLEAGVIEPENPDLEDVMKPEDADSESKTDEESEPDAPGEQTPSLETLSYKDLQEKAKSLNLPYVGVSKSDLIESITKASEAGKEEGTKGEENLGDDL